VREQAAAEAVEDARDQRADPAGADDAGGAAVEVEAEQAVEGEVALAHAVEGAVGLAVEGQDQRQRMLGDRVRGVGRHPGHRDPEGARHGEVDVVEAGAAQRDQPHAPPGQVAQHRAVEFVVDEGADGPGAVRQHGGLRRQARLEVAEAVARRGVGRLEEMPVIRALVGVGAQIGAGAFVEAGAGSMGSASPPSG
jgi:hypothetical protein